MIWSLKFATARAWELKSAFCKTKLFEDFLQFQRIRLPSVMPVTTWTVSWIGNGQIPIGSRSKSPMITFSESPFTVSTISIAQEVKDRATRSPSRWQAAFIWFR